AGSDGSIAGSRACRAASATAARDSSRTTIPITRWRWRTQRRTVSRASSSGAIAGPPIAGSSKPTWWRIEMKEGADTRVARSFLKLGAGEALARIIAFGATVYLARLLGPGM